MHSSYFQVFHKFWCFDVTNIFSSWTWGFFWWLQGTTVRVSQETNVWLKLSELIIPIAWLKHISSRYLAKFQKKKMVKMFLSTLLEGPHTASTKDQRNQLGASHVSNRHPNIASGHVDLKKWFWISDTLGTPSQHFCPRNHARSLFWMRKIRWIHHHEKSAHLQILTIRYLLKSI